MIHKTVGFLKSSAKKVHKWLGFGPSISILAVFLVGGISFLATPSAKLQTNSPYIADSTEIALVEGAIFSDSSVIGEIGASNSSGGSYVAAVEASSYLNNAGTASFKGGQNGFVYTVRKGDNLSSIASNFNTTVSRIMSLNNIARANSIRVGQAISIPDTESLKPVERVPNYSTLPNISGNLSFPLADNQKEFRYLNYDHTDIRSQCGATIYASAGGLVESAGNPEERNEGNGGFVMIQHPFGNSPKTYYAHTSKNLVSLGDMVEKGDPIAEVGSTGESDVSGCNLRFGVIGAKNPFAKYID